MLRVFQAMSFLDLFGKINSLSYSNNSVRTNVCSAVTLDSIAG